jgi:hypothetical protein
MERQELQDRIATARRIGDQLRRAVGAKAATSAALIRLSRDATERRSGRRRDESQRGQPPR